MATIGQYSIIGGNTLRATVEANATSTELSWYYTFEYSTSGCHTQQIIGYDTHKVTFKPNNEMIFKQSTGYFTWQGLTIEYHIVQRPGQEAVQWHEQGEHGGAIGDPIDDGGEVVIVNPRL